MLKVMQFNGKELLSVKTIKGCIADAYKLIKDTNVFTVVKDGDKVVAEWYWHSMHNEWTLNIY